MPEYTDYNQPVLPTSTLLGIYPNELKIYVYIKAWTKMFTAVLFKIAKTGKKGVL